MSQFLSFRSFRFKIAIVFFGVFLIVISISNYFLFYRVKSSIIDTYHQGVKAEAEGIAKGLVESPGQIPPTAEDQPIQIWFKSEFDSEKYYQRIDFPEVYPDLFSVLQEEPLLPETESSIILELDSFTFCLTEKQIVNQQFRVVSLILAKNNKPVYQQISSVRTWMIVANIGAALLSLIIALFLSQYALRPIQKIITRAKSIRASESMERLPSTKANDEISELVKTINDMISGIESSIKTQNQFFTSAAHELRTPLANMLAELDLRIEDETKAQHKELFSSQRDEVIRLKYVVQDFLLMSQLKADTLTIQSVVFRLDDLLYDVLEKMNRLITENQFDLSLNIGSLSEVKIRGDKSKMESILVNIIQNAVKYGSNSKPIRISQDLFSSTIELTVVNQVDRKRQELSGNKLGLWICGKLAEKQGFSFYSSDENGVFTTCLSIPI